MSGPLRKKRYVRNLLIHGWPFVEEAMRFEKDAVIGGVDYKSVRRAFLNFIQDTSNFMIDKRVRSKVLLRPDRLA